jgi:hypothetical protein
MRRFSSPLKGDDHVNNRSAGGTSSATSWTLLGGVLMSLTYTEDPKDFDAATIIATLNRHGVHESTWLLSRRVRPFPPEETSTSLRPPMITIGSDRHRRCTS